MAIFEPESNGTRPKLGNAYAGRDYTQATSGTRANERRVALPRNRPPPPTLPSACIADGAPAPQLGQAVVPGIALQHRDGVVEAAGDAEERQRQKRERRSRHEDICDQLLGAHTLACACTVWECPISRQMGSSSERAPSPRLDDACFDRTLDNPFRRRFDRTSKSRLPSAGRRWQLGPQVSDATHQRVQCWPSFAQTRPMSAKFDVSMTLTGRLANIAQFAEGTGRQEGCRKRGRQGRGVSFDNPPLTTRLTTPSICEWVHCVAQ